MTFILRGNVNILKRSTQILEGIPDRKIEEANGKLIVCLVYNRFHFIK